MSKLMLTVDDATDIAIRHAEPIDGIGRDLQREVIYSDMEQKAWLNSERDAYGAIKGLICDINPDEIAAQIGRDNLGQWCQAVQASLQMNLRSLTQDESQEDDGK
jgi:hypothetical protein